MTDHQAHENQELTFPRRGNPVGHGVSDNPGSRGFVRGVSAVVEREGVDTLLPQIALF